MPWLPDPVIVMTGKEDPPIRARTNAAIRSGSACEEFPRTCRVMNSRAAFSSSGSRLVATARISAYDDCVKRLAHTIKNLIYPDPRYKGAAQALEEHRLNKEVPWKRSDWIALVILSLVISTTLAKRFDDSRIEINRFLDSRSSFQTYTRREIMEIVLYGEISHTNDKHYALVKKWKADQLFWPVVFLDFLKSVQAVFEFVIWAKSLNEKTIKELQK